MKEQNRRSGNSFISFEVLDENTVKTLDADGDEVTTEVIKFKIND